MTSASPRRRLAAPGILALALAAGACGDHREPFSVGGDVRVETAYRIGGLLFVRLKPDVRPSEILATDLFASLHPGMPIESAASVCSDFRSRKTNMRDFLGCEEAALAFGRGWRFRFADRRVELADERHASGNEVRVHRVLRLFFPDRGVPVGEVFRLAWPASLREARLHQLVVADADRPFAEATIHRDHVTAVAWMRE